MYHKSFKTKLIAVFLVAFVCLNAGGTACVAYCQTSNITAEAPDHCPLQKKASHCDPAGPSNESTANATSSKKMSCCPMLVNFFAAPVEKRPFSFETAAVVPVAEEYSAKPLFLRKAEQVLIEAYRGPPLDRRVERLKHRLIRI